MADCFTIKICGVTTVDDALAAQDAGADAIGLNFYSPSPRSVTVAQAAAIAEACGSILKVGVFVNHTVEQIAAICEQTPLDVVQLHGDEPPQVIRDLAPRQIVRAFRCKDNVQQAYDYLAECARLEALPSAVLLDAYAVGVYGGAGQVLDWEMVRRSRSQLSDRPIILAGGLQPENVAEAIRLARPDAIDTASGVEESPGKKSPDRMKAFVAAARAAFAELNA